MMWADRAGLGVAAFVFVVLYILMAALGAANVDEAWPTLRVALVCGGLVWAVCRTVDFIFGGPARRASKN